MKFMFLRIRDRLVLLQEGGNTQAKHSDSRFLNRQFTENTTRSISVGAETFSTPAECYVYRNRRIEPLALQRSAMFMLMERGHTSM